MRPRTRRTVAVAGPVGKPCGVCGASVRRMFPHGKGNKARVQHSKFWVCEKGHKLYIKRR